MQRVVTSKLGNAFVVYNPFRFYNLGRDANDKEHGDSGD